jgi:hypothetical protein
VIYLIRYYYRLKCVFGQHLWVGTLAGDGIDDPVEYYWCLHCNKEQLDSPYKEGK